MKKSIAEKNYYQLLCVDQDASAEQIQKAFRDLERIYGPDSDFFADIVADPPRPEHHEIFARIKLAFNTLIDAEKRRLYDESLSRNTATAEESPTYIPPIPGNPARQGRIISNQGAPVRRTNLNEEASRLISSAQSFEQAYGNDPPPRPVEPPLEPAPEPAPGTRQPERRAQKATMYFPPEPGNPITEFRRHFYGGELPPHLSPKAAPSPEPERTATSPARFSSEPLPPPTVAVPSLLNSAPASSAPLSAPPSRSAKPATPPSGFVTSPSRPSPPAQHSEPTPGTTALTQTFAPPPAMRAPGRVTDLVGQSRAQVTGFGAPLPRVSQELEENGTEVMSMSEIISMSESSQWRSRLRWLIFLIVFQTLFLLLILII